MNRKKNVNLNISLSVCDWEDVCLELSLVHDSLLTIITELGFSDLLHLTGRLFVDLRQKPAN